MKKQRNALLALFALVCFSTIEAHDFEVNGLYYNIISEKDSTCHITFKGEDYLSPHYNGAIVIPGHVITQTDDQEKKYYVTGIGSHAFYLCDELKSIVLSDSINSIGENAFYGCSGLTSVKLPDNLEKISENTFNGCIELKEVIFGKDIKHIENCAFKGCSNLETSILPEKLTHIGEFAFEGCRNLKITELPNSLTHIGIAAFRDCSSLSKLSIPNNVCYLGISAFEGCSELTDTIQIPNGVKEIASSLFNGCSNLESVLLPNSITSIGNHAFDGCANLDSIVIPDGVMDIETSVFKGCTNLTYVQLPKNLSRIPTGMFRDCKNLKSITLPKRITKIESFAFYGCDNLTSINLESEVVPTLGDNNFTDAQTISVPVNSWKEYTSSSVWNTLDDVRPAGTHMLAYWVEGVRHEKFYLNQGSAVPAPSAVAEKIGHTFGWEQSIPAQMPGHDTKITGSYTINKYTIIYKVNGEEYEKMNVEYGKNISIIPEPSKEGYTFSGWSSTPKTMPANDITVEGEFTPNVYTVSYIVDGEEYLTEHITYGSIIKPADAPIKAGETFSGWSEIPETMPAYDITVTGSFSQTDINANFGAYGIEGISTQELIDVYNLQGIRIKEQISINNLKDLPTGIYIIKGQKISIK